MLPENVIQVFEELTFKFQSQVAYFGIICFKKIASCHYLVERPKRGFNESILPISFRKSLKRTAIVSHKKDMSVLVGKKGVTLTFIWTNAHSTKAPINLPVNKNKDDDFYGIVTFLP